MKIINDLRIGVYDVLVGINLLREGLDLPEVSLVAILDADKEGFLRNETSLIQTIGRAARNAQGQVIMYAEHITESMQRAIDETNRRRSLQQAYNEAHGIVPKTIIKSIRDVIEATKSYKSEDVEPELNVSDAKEQILELTEEMNLAVKNLDFERAAYLRDKILEIKLKVNLDE
jgi:excinuclease ABC subunit B